MAAPPDPQPAPRSAPPLRNRLPNPPPVFVGREAELAAFNQALARFSVTVLCGPGGVGKTAMALRGLANQPAFAPDRALLIELRSGEPVEDPRLQIIGVLARAQGLERVSWAEVLNDDEAIGGALIDLAEERGWWVMLDDLHHLPAEAGEGLLRLLARYARQSRWVVTSRRAPELPELRPQVLHLRGLDEPALRTLALSFAPDLSEAQLQSAIAESAGSPWMLHQTVMSPKAGPDVERLLGGLPAETSSFLRALAGVDRALALEDIGAITTTPTDDVLKALMQRGLVQRTFDGYRLHDVVRRVLRAARPLDLPATSRATGLPLAGSADPEATLEGTRLLLTSGATEDVITALERSGDQLIEDGHAPRLLQLLQLDGDPRLDRWRLACAVATAQPAQLAKIAPPAAHEPPRVRLLYARGLHIQGRHEDALELAAAVQEVGRAQGDEPLEADAALVKVAALEALDRSGEAIALLRSLKPSADQARHAVRESWLILCLATEERHDEASERLELLERARADLPPRTAAEIAPNLARAIRFLGRYADSYAASKAIVASSLPTERSLRAYFVSAIAAGAFDEAGKVLARLEPYSTPGSPLRATFNALTLLHRVQVGALQGIEHLFSSVKQEYIRLGDSSRLQVVLQWERTYRAMRGEPPTTLEGETLVASSTSWTENMRRSWALRAGACSPQDALADLRTNTLPPGPLGVLYMLHEALALLIAGAPNEALLCCERGLERCRRAGWRESELDALQLRCEVLLVLGDAEPLRQAADELATLGADCGSPRVQGEARFFTAFTGPRPADWGSLETTYSLIDVSPIAARRAAALLGERVPLDALDACVLGALRTHRRVVPARVPRRADEPTHSTLGLADDGCQVWLHDGRSFSLADRPQLWQILVCIVERGGAASKEQLVCGVWGLNNYHPLRHDNRLQVAIRKLRRLIEADPSKPALLVTTEEGYALSGTVRRAGRA